MTNETLVNDTKDLSVYIYKDGISSIPSGFKSIKVNENKLSGFYAEAFYKNGKIVLFIEALMMLWTL